MKDLEESLAIAQQLSDVGDHEQACRLLGECRRALFADLQSHQTAAALPLLRVIERQVAAFLAMRRASDAITAADWFLRLIAHQGAETQHLIMGHAREAFAALFLRIAQAHGQEGAFAEMRRQMTTALDLTQVPEAAVLRALTLYAAAAAAHDSIEGANREQWLAQRVAELMAQLDFRGFSGEVRAALGAYHDARFAGQGARAHETWQARHGNAANPHEALAWQLVADMVGQHHQRPTSDID